MFLQADAFLLISAWLTMIDLGLDIDLLPNGRIAAFDLPQLFYTDTFALFAN